ncbi:MAG TPA: acyloxyacyl hydrolase [Myxococcaceae bacterium]|nr:acyloxyacyl hydrolase [Myxococcaceae bacterium]
MPTLRAVAASAVLLSSSAAWCAEASDPPPVRSHWWEPEAMVLYGGSYGLRVPHQPNELMVAVELRTWSFFWYLHLMSGLLGAGDGSGYFYVGLTLDFPVDLLHFLVSFSPGLYNGGAHHDLGYPLIFRSAAEISLTIVHGVGLGVAFSHMSNGRLATRNSGVETLCATLTFAVGP